MKKAPVWMKELMDSDIQVQKKYFEHFKHRFDRMFSLVDLFTDEQEASRMEHFMHPESFDEMKMVFEEKNASLVVYIAYANYAELLVEYAELYGVKDLIAVLESSGVDIGVRTRVERAVLTIKNKKGLEKPARKSCL